MLPSGNNNNSDNIIKLQGVISSKGDGRKIINIPHAFHIQIGEHKKLMVILKSID